jgi:hypothetical protein
LRSLSFGVAEETARCSHLHLTAAYLGLGVIGILSAERVEKLAVVESPQHLRFSGCGYMLKMDCSCLRRCLRGAACTVYTRFL